MARSVINTAAAIHKQIQRGNEDYEAECAEWRRQGFRPHYCRHGANQWVDYDNICQGCEDDRSDMEVALDLAHEAHSESDRRIAEYVHIGTSPVGNSIPQAVRTMLLEWALEPVTRAMFVVSR